MPDWDCHANFHFLWSSETAVQVFRNKNSPYSRFNSVYTRCLYEFMRHLYDICPTCVWDEKSHENFKPFKILAEYLRHAETSLRHARHLYEFHTTLFIRPSSDGTYYGMVMSVRPSVRPSQFSALFSYMLWDIELKFCLSLYYDARKSKFECHQFPSIFDGVMPLFNFKLLQICSFPHFSPSCFDISSWNLAYDFVLLYYRTSSSVDDFRQFLLELCPFWNLEYWKYTVFRTFLLHALTYWAEICIWLCFTVLQIKFQCCQFPSIFVGVMPLLERRILEIQSFPHFPLTGFDILSWNFAYDFVLLYYRSSSSVVNFRQFLWELCPFWNVENWKYTVFRILFFHALTYWAEILHLTFTVLEIKFECRQFPSIFVGVMPL